jgi:DNA replication protein DnaC
MELHTVLDKLKLTLLAERIESVCEQASKRELNYKEFLLEALSLELNDKQQKGVEQRTVLARLPYIKTIEQFDFSFQPSIDKKVVRELAGLSFVERCENVILLGPPGVGKTHLSIALAVKAIAAGHRVLFMTLDQMLTKLKRAREENKLEKVITTLVQPKVLVLDEIGYMPMGREDASLFFRVITRRYEKASTILTSNKSFVDWGEVFGDPVLATAILDRLLHHATTLNIKGESYRLKEKRRAGLLGAAQNLPQETTLAEEESAIESNL